MSIGSEITQLLINQGTIAANRAQQQGQITAQTIGGVTQAAQGAIQQLTDPKVLEYQRTVKGRKVLAAGLKTVPPKEDGTPDYQGIAAYVGQNGFPDLGESFLDSSTKNQANLATLDKLKRDAKKANDDLQAHTMQTIGDAAFHSNSPASFQSAVGVLHAHGQLDDKTAMGILGAADQGGPDGWQAIRDKYLQFSPAWNEEQKERRKTIVIPREGASVTTQGAVEDAGGQVTAPVTPKPETQISLAKDAATIGTPTETQTAAQSKKALDLLKPQTEKGRQAEWGMVDGKKMAIAFDPATGKRYDAAGNDVTAKVQPIPTEGQLNRDALGADIKLTDGQERIAADLATGMLSMQQFNRMMGTRGSSPAIKQAMYLKARDINPDFNPVTFEAGAKMFSNPQIRQRMTAIDQLTPVINQINELVQKSGNTSIPELNKLIQSGKFHLGDTTVTDLRQMQTLLGDEVGNALGVGTGSDLKTRLGIDLVNTTLGPKQFASTMQQLKSVLGARRNALAQMMGPYSKDSESKDADVKQTHAVGDIVTVRGQKVKVTKLLPDGKYEGEVVK